LLIYTANYGQTKRMNDYFFSSFLLLFIHYKASEGI